MMIENKEKRIIPEYDSILIDNDSEFIELFNNFTFDVVSNDDLDDTTRYMAILATLIGCMGIEEYRIMLPIALRCHVSPIEIKEIVYQGVAYLGMGRMYSFLKVTNEIFIENKITLPLSSCSTTTKDNRRELGSQAQVDIFGDHMKEFYKSGPKESRHINKWLAANCFGDYYTRKGLNYKQREMITFCFLSAQGGCESQLISHTLANLKIGNDKKFLIKIISQCLPYIGYPRSLNALKCVNEGYDLVKDKEN